jgi:hypothetical protein
MVSNKDFGLELENINYSLINGQKSNKNTNLADFAKVWSSYMMHTLERDMFVCSYGHK